MLKVQNRTARKPYIEDKEGLEDGIPNRRRLGEGSVLAKAIKRVCSASARRPAEFERINARAARAIGAKYSYSPQITTRTAAAARVR